MHSSAAACHNKLLPACAIDFSVFGTGHSSLLWGWWLHFPRLCACCPPHPVLFTTILSIFKMHSGNMLSVVLQLQLLTGVVRRVLLWVALLQYIAEQLQPASSKQTLHVGRCCLHHSTSLCNKLYISGVILVLCKCSSLNKHSNIIGTQTWLIIQAKKHSMNTELIKINIFLE